MKSIIARFTELKENVDGTSESEFDDLDYNDVDKALKSIGVSLKDANGQFKNTDDVLLEVSKKWKGLSRNTQRYVATVAAGSRQQSRFLAMVSDYDRTVELIDAAYNSSGKSQQQFEKNMDTISFKTKRLKSSWESLRQSFIESDFFKNATDSANGLLQTLNNLSKADILAIASSFLLFGKTAVQNLTDSLGKITTGTGALIGQGFDIINKKVLKINADVSTEKVKAKIEQLKNDIAELEQQKAIVPIDADTTQIDDKIEQLRRELSELLKQKNNTLQNLDKNTEKYRKIQTDAADAFNLYYNSDDTKEWVDTSNWTSSYLRGDLEFESALPSDRIDEFKQSSTFEKLKSLREEYQEYLEYEKELADIQTKIEETKKGLEDTIKIRTQSSDGKSKNIDREIEKKNKELKKQQGKAVVLEGLDEQTAGMRGQAYGQAFSVGLISAITTGILNDNPLNAMAQTASSIGISTGLQLLPNVIDGAMSAASKGLPVITTILGTLKSVVPVLAVITISMTAISGVISFIKNKIQEIEDNKIENRLAAAKKELEELQETANASTTSANEEKSTAKSMQDLKDEYEELNSKQVKTTEEQERYTELVSQVREQFPEIITYYDEATGKLQVQNDLWQNMIDKQKELSKSETTKAYIDNVVAANKELETEQLSAESESSTLLKNVIADDYDTVREILETYKNDAQVASSQLNQLSEKGIAWQEIFDKTGINIDYNEMSDDDAIALADMLYGIENPNSKKFEGIQKYYDTLEKVIEDNTRRAEKKFKDEQVAYLSQSLQGLTDETEAITDYIATQFAGKSPTLKTDEITSWDSIEEKPEYHDIFINKAGITQEVFEEKFNADENAYKEELSQIYTAAKSQERALVGIENMTQKQKDAINNFANKVSEMSATELLNYDVPGLENFDEYKQKYIDELNDAIKDATSFTTYGEDEFSSWTTGQIQQFSQVMAKIGDTLGEDTAKSFADASLKFKEQYNLSAKEFSAILSTDLTEVDLTNIDDSKKALIEVLEETMTSDEAKNVVEAFYSMAEDLGPLDLKIDTEGALKTIEDQVRTALDGIVDSFSKTIEPVIENQLTNGFINYSDYSSLATELKEMKLDINDYVKTTSNGYVLDTEKLRDAYVNLTLTQDQLVEAAKAQIQQAITEEQQKLTTLQLYQAQLNATASQISLNNTIIAQLQTMNLLQGKSVPASGIVSFNPSQLAAEKKSVADAIKTSNTQIDNLQKLLNDDTYLKNIAQMGNSAAGEILSDYNDAQQKVADNQSKVADSQKKVADAQKKVADAEKKVAEAEKDLQEALYGTEWYEPAIDHLYNYTTLIERLGEQADKTKEKIDNLKADDNVEDLVSKYRDLIHQEAVATKAENAVIEQSVQNFLKVLDENYVGYYSMINDRVMIDIKALADAPMNDDLKSYAMETAQQINELLDQIDDNNDKLEKRLEEAEQIRKDARDKVIDLQDKVVEVLKEKYQEEIDATKDKYSALEEADSDYLDALEEAIEKQRKLRDKENSYEELAQKERKLALLRRDTSGANQKDVLSLEEDVKKDRQSLLDDEVDSLIDSMKEMYETQKEARDAEIEYLEDVLDAADLYKEAAEIISSWASQEDMTSWFFENNPEVESMTVEKLEQYRDELDELYSARELYMITSTTDFTDALNTTQGEVEATISAISETLTDEADRSLGEVQEKVAEAQEKAREALQDAIDALADAQQSAADAIAGTAQTAMSYMQEVSNLYSTLMANNMYNSAGSQTVMGAGGLTTAENEELKALQNKSNKTAEDKKRIKQLQNKGKTHSVSQTGVNPITGVQGQSLTSAVSNVRIQSGYDWKNDIASHKSSKDSNGKQRNYVFSTGTDSYYFSTQKEMQDWYNKWKNTGRIGGLTKDSNGNFAAKARVRSGKHGFTNIKNFKYADGGLVNYTGPAWVDGTPNKPEAFLNSEDTKRIGQAAELLANLPIFNNTSNANNAVSATYGDTNVSVNITVESIANDYDVDRMMKRVEERITSAAKPIGTSVILKK